MMAEPDLNKVDIWIELAPGVSLGFYDGRVGLLPTDIADLARRKQGRTGGRKERPVDWWKDESQEAALRDPAEQPDDEHDQDDRG